MPKTLAVLVLPWFLIAPGCSRDMVTKQQASSASTYMPEQPALVAHAVASSPSIASATRFIARREKLIVETSESHLPKA